MSLKYLGSAFSRQPSSWDLLVKAKTFLITFHQSVLIMQFKSEQLRKPPVRSIHLHSFSASEMQPQERTNAISLTPQFVLESKTARISGVSVSFNSMFRRRLGPFTLSIFRMLYIYRWTTISFNSSPATTFHPAFPKILSYSKVFPCKRHFPAVLWSSAWFWLL